MAADSRPPEASDDADFEIHTSVTDELYSQLEDEVLGRRLAGVALWEESLTQALDDEPVEPEQQVLFDLDLYLEGGVTLELYGVVTYTNPESDPLQGLDPVGAKWQELVERGVLLEELGVDEEDGLVLVLANQHIPALYLSVGGWVLAEWETLPEED